MADILRTTRDEEGRKRDDAALYQVQQQIDNLQRQLREAVARQQWLEDLYKSTEGQVLQLQMQQERHAQDVSQTLQVRQIEDGRVKQQLTELTQKVEEPLKPIRDLRAQLGELIDARRQDREKSATDIRQAEALQGQIRQLVSQIGMIADAQRQLRDLVQELDAVNNETRQEIQRVGELQRLEEQRLRRQGIELQEMVETLKVQFGEVVSRAARVDDVRRQVTEQVETIQAELHDMQELDARLLATVGRLEKQAIENHASLQDHAETVRAAFAAELTDLRQLGDQRMERYINRFQQLEDRIRDLDQRVGDHQPHFEALYRRGEEIEGLIDALEERHLKDEIHSLEEQMEQMRQRRAKKQSAAAQKASLVRNVREARPHQGPVADPAPDGEE
ncbi:MAG TPA: hypothetical protein VKY74_22805 [Chloroflexia bacterium]|nr:hypothetical protein [Chloroflexia bacterium]